MHMTKSLISGYARSYRVTDKRYANLIKDRFRKKDSPYLIKYQAIEENWQCQWK